jgi:hypothetical protein
MANDMPRPQMYLKDPANFECHVTVIDCGDISMHPSKYMHPTVATLSQPGLTAVDGNSMAGF